MSSPEEIEATGPTPDSHEASENASSNPQATLVRRIASFSSPGFDQLWEEADRQSGRLGNTGLVVGFVGCQIGSGTTTVSVHAAICSAVERQLKTLLIDANFRSPCLHQIFEIESPLGLSDCLIESGEPDFSVKESGIANLFVLPNGSARLKKRKGLDQRFVNLTQKLAEEFSLIIVDLSDAKSQACIAFNAGIDLLYLVGNPHRDSAQRMHRIHKRFQQQNVSLHGLFLNKKPH